MLESSSGGGGGVGGEIEAKAAGCACMLDDVDICLYVWVCRFLLECALVGWNRKVGAQDSSSIRRGLRFTDSRRQRPKRKRSDRSKGT